MQEVQQQNLGGIYRLVNPDCCGVWAPSYPPAFYPLPGRGMRREEPLSLQTHRAYQGQRGSDKCALVERRSSSLIKSTTSPTPQSQRNHFTTSTGSRIIRSSRLVSAFFTA